MTTAATSLRTARLPRDLHPVAWWVWALGLAAAASMTTNPFSLLLLVGAAAVVVAARRSDQPWSRSFRLYLWLGLAIVVLRVVFRLLLGGGYPGTVLLDLPSIPLPEWTTGITLLGAVTLESVLAGLYDGMRLASIVVCVGAANALANPKRLLRSVPPALYEVGAAMVVAVTVLPQLADSARRVRAAQGLRAGATGRVHGIRRFLVPVLEDAIDRSMAMAAGMDARGYGRAPGLDRRARVRTGALMIVGLCGTCLGTYAVLDRTAPRLLALPVLLLGVGLAVLGLVSAGRRVERTRYRPDSWLWPEWVVAGAGVLTAALWVWIARTQLTIAYPGLDAVPVIGLGVLAGVVVAVAGGLAAPPPVSPPVPRARMAHDQAEAVAA
ncbi:MAG: energy-coupling factor transporter transmembrane component T [Actinomycetota bacterium]|nr:energy-coupling factor transporter transmembrane component T [Actinomycetota bacterium]MEE3128282.1 energy-coupling factor transporter transmembrane component T [Actinomycetota bacterium]